MSSQAYDLTTTSQMRDILLLEHGDLMKKLALILLLLAACTPAGRPIATPSPRPIPTVISTPVPPLVAHEWSQSKPLITYGNVGGYRDPLAQAWPLRFTLLPSGDLYLRSSIELSGQVILTTKLSRQATCKLLNSIDQAGFFDYDPSSYSGQGPTDAGTTDISVHAWRANSASLYVGFLFDMPRADQLRRNPAILPIRDTYRLLGQYYPRGAVHILKPGRMGVWLNGPGGSIRAGTNDYIEWPLKSYTLAAATAPGGSLRDSLRPHDSQTFREQVETAGQVLLPPDMILTGQDATQVYDALGETFNEMGTFVREGDKWYRVFARPLLPNEYNTSPLPQVSLSCSPSDGSMQAP